MTSAQASPPSLTEAIKQTFQDKHGGPRPTLSDAAQSTLQAIESVPVQVKAGVLHEGANTFHLKAELATESPTATGQGKGLDLTHLAKSKASTVVGVNLKLSWTVDHTGDPPSLSIETGEIRGCLKVGPTASEACVFRVYYDIDQQVLAAGWEQEWADDGGSFEPGHLTSIYSEAPSLALPPTFPFRATGAYFICDIHADFLFAKLKTKMGSAFVALGEESKFHASSAGGDGAAHSPDASDASADSETDYLALLGAQLDGVEIKRLPLVNKKLSAFGLKPIQLDHLGLVAATAAKKEVAFTADELSAFGNKQFKPPGTAGWTDLNPKAARDFFAKLELEDGVSMVGELSVGALSDVVVMPFYRPDEHTRHRHRVPQQPKATDAPAETDRPDAVVTEAEETDASVTPRVESRTAEGDEASSPARADHGDKSSGGSTVHWTPLQASVSVLDFARIGALVQNEDGTPKITILLDVSATVAGLRAKFYGLGARFDTTGTAGGSGGIVDDFQMVLHGLQIGFSKGGVQVGAGLLRTETPSGDEVYTGDAVLRAEEYGFSGVGSFSTGTPPSLYLFVFLDAPVGTPTIHVEQMAAGFGYNRGAASPDISSLDKYPLIQTMVSGDVNLSRYNNTFPPKSGNVWLGAGVQFSSWELINASVIPLLSAGTQSSVNIVGTASIAIPKGRRPPVLIALALEASFSFNTGRLSFGGELLPKTHIVFQDASFKGGFGICTWLPTPLMSPKQKKKVGDYVLTLGGYHPKLQVPSYYPTVPRIGADVTVSEAVSIRGNIYAALTPSALMFGGTLAAVLQYDAFKASFQAKLDVVMRWTPLHYDAKVHVDISVQVTVHFFGTHTISAHVGAGVHLQGPPIHGTATIDLSVFSTTVHFGEKPGGAKRLTSWDEFKKAFLGADTGQAGAPSGADGTSLARSRFCTVHVTKGLAQRYPRRDSKPAATNGAPDGNGRATEGGEKPLKGWIVHPRTLRLAVQTQVPSTEVTVQTADGAHAETYTPSQMDCTDQIGVAPTLKPDGTGGIQQGDLRPRLTITVSRVSDEGTPNAALVKRLKKNLSWDTAPVPKSMWGGQPAELAAGPDAQVQDALMGVGLEATVDAPDETHTFAWTHLVEDDRTRSPSAPAPPAKRRAIGARLSRTDIANAFQKAGVPDRGLLDALGDSGFAVSAGQVSVRRLDKADQQGFLVPPRTMHWT